MNNTHIADTILSQLGGNKFLAMTGAYNLVALDNGISMRLRKNKSRANHLRIILTPMDEYDMSFGRFTLNNPKGEIVQEFKGQWFDQLQERFTEVTGMYTKL